MKKVIFLIFAGALLMFGSCTKKSQINVPLPYAYPRPSLPDTVMTVPEDVPLVFPVNAQAEEVMKRADWLDVVYPTLGATVHVTFTATNPLEVESIKENRMQRLMLNAGERPVEFSEFFNEAGFNVVTADAEGATTPIQFIATDDSLWVISGAVYFSAPEAVESTDSIRPMVKAIRNDILRGLKALRYR